MRSHRRRTSYLEDIDWRSVEPRRKPMSPQGRRIVAASILSVLVIVGNAANEWGWQAHRAAIPASAALDEFSSSLSAPVTPEEPLPSASSSGPTYAEMLKQSAVHRHGPPTPSTLPVQVDAIR